MEFLQRHLPRVYQAVQNALEYLTNVTAQIFGAPPNAPQPRNAPAKTPLKFEDTAAPEKQEESCESQDADHMTLDVSLEDAALEATEESMKKYVTQQDVENQGHETQIRHRKESVDRRPLDLHHTVGDGKDAFIHHQVTVEKHKAQSCNIVITDNAKLTKPDDVNDILSSVTREVLHFEVHAVTNEEVQKINQEALVYEEHTRNKTEEKPSTFLEDVLKALESKSFQEHEVLPTSNELLKSNLNLENKENSCSSSNVNNSPSLEKTIIIHEVSEGACHVIITSEEVDQESSHFSAPPIIMENDDLDVSDIKGQHKKLVTPVSAADSSPRDQREEANKTWEHLQETAVRLALHCDLLQDDDQKFETLGYGEISKTTYENEMHLSRPDEQGDGGEHLEKTSHDQNEVQELNSKEKERSEEISGFSKSKEGNQHDEQNQNIEKMRKRVHFSPSTEERDLMFDLASEDTVCIKVDLTQDGALQPTTEYSDQPPNSYPRPEADDKEHDFGLISNRENIEPSMMDPITEEDRMNAPYMGHTVWYDELKITTDKEMCESICLSRTSSCQPEETIAAITNKESAKKPSTDVPSVEMQDCEEEPFKNLVSTPHGLLTHSGVDFEMAYDYEEGTCSFNKVDDGSLEKSPAVISDLWKQDGSNFADNEDISVSVEVISQPSEEITDIESLKQQVHGEGDNEDTKSKDELFGLQLQPLMEETKDSAKGGLTLMTDELNSHQSFSRLQGELKGPSETTPVVYTPDESYNQTSVQELDISKNEQGDMISTESKRQLSRDISNIYKAQTAEDPAAGEDNEGSVERNLPLKTETQEEDKAGMEYEDEKHIREVKLQELEDYTWYTQNGYQSDDLITYSDSSNVLESPKGQNPLEKIDELSEQSPDKGSESEVMSKDGEIEQTNVQLGGSDEDSTKVNYLYIAPEAEPRNVSLFYPGDSLGSGNELEGINRPSETGFDLLSEIESMINRSQSEQDISKMTGRSDVTHGAVSSGDMGMESTESGFLGEINFQTDNVAKDLDLQCMLRPGQPVNKTPEDLAEDNQNSVSADEVLRDESIDGVQELEIHLDTSSLAEDNIEVILDQHFEMGSFSEPQDRSDLLSELHSVMSVNHSVMPLDHEILEMMCTMNAGQSDKVMEDVGHSNEENQAQILSAKTTIEENENLEVHRPGLHLSEEIGSLIELKQIPEEEHYSSIEIAVTESTTDVSDVGLDINNMSVVISENKEQEDDQAEEDASYVTLDEITNDTSLHIDKEQEPPLDAGCSAEDNIEDILKQNVEVDNFSEPQDGSDLLSELHPMLSVDDSVMSVDHKVLEIMSTVNVVQLDKGIFAVGQSNEENIAGILSAKTTVEENENLDVHSHGLHLSEEFGSLIKPKQIPEEEHYSSFEIAATESTTEVSDVGLDINSTSVEIYEDQEDDRAEDKCSVTVDETSSRHLDDQPQNNVNELEIPLDAGSFAEEHIEVIVGSVSHSYFGTLEEGDDLLSNMDPSVEVIVSTMNVDESDKRREDGGHSNDKAIFEHHEDPEEDYSHMCLAEELGSIIKPEHTFEAYPYSSIVVTETQEEASNINYDSKTTESVLMNKTDPSIDSHHELIPDCTVENISENKDEAVESQSFETLDDASGRQFGELEVNEPVIPLETGSLTKDIGVILGFTSEISQGEGDLLSDIHSVETISHPTEVISLFSTTGEEDILDTSKAWDILDESAVQVDTLADTIIPYEQKIQNSISTISCPEVLVPSLEPSQELEENQHISLDNHESEEIDLLSEVRSVVTTDYSMEVTTIISTVKVVTSDEASVEIITTDGKEGSEETTQELCPSESKEEMEKKLLDEQDSSSTTLTIGTEYGTDFDINKSSETSEYLGLSGSEIRLLPSIDPTKQEGMEGENEEQLSSDEALYLGQKKQVITIYTDEPLKVIEPPIHMEMCEDQEPPVVDHKGTLMEPSAEEEDDIDNSLLPHNTLDVSAQKSRVQLRRKTSIRRKQGQRQVPSESEPLEPTQPVIRPRPIGKMPIFKMAPTMAPIVSHPEEEQKEEKPAEEDLLVKPKKGIPRHAGFGIPHPQMMQELQARLKKKKPNE
ncbi:apolipoprotein B receptor [Eleutherodactylus coqui]|uniref:apolipoprotein B receptor n=1 Tax=Eleutherodactylus coqui TaxID=57060 RepID=UPI0034629E80